MRIRLWLAIGVALLATSLPIACMHSAEQARRRETGYQEQLAAFSHALKPGMTRKEVESYLRKNGRQFLQMCCMGTHGSALDDLTRIGQEGHPWYCSAHNVYIGFEFVSDGSHKSWEADDSDRLKSVQIYHWLVGCL